MPKELLFGSLDRGSLFPEMEMDIAHDDLFPESEPWRKSQKVVFKKTYVPPMKSEDLEFLMRGSEVPFAFQDPLEILLAKERGRIRRDRRAREAKKPYRGPRLYIIRTHLNHRFPSEKRLGVVLRPQE